MVAWFNVMVSRLRGFFRPSTLDREFNEELEAHLAMAEEEKVRQGMSRDEARRAARIELGGITQLREAGREARGLPWVDPFLLDAKLGLRMLRKHWGLSLVAGLAMTVVISIGVVMFAFFELAFQGILPLDEGERVVAVEAWDVKGRREIDTSIQDFQRWRIEIEALDDVGAFETVQRNLIIGEGAFDSSSGGRVELVSVAEITASGFRLARVLPILGRTVIDDDEHVSSPPILVIGEEVWTSKFDRDPNVVGQTVRLGATTHTVVGVMPEGFAFPVNHGFWTAFQRESWDHLSAESNSTVFARLAPGSTLKSAQAEVAALGLVPSAFTAQAIEEGRLVRARVAPYTLALMGDFDGGQMAWVARIIFLLGAFLLAPPCANIAILVYARTITRQQEFATRYALGAGRRRIVSQLFVELLVLAGVAASVSLLVAAFALKRVSASVNAIAGDAAPFWFDFSLSLRTVLFAAGLAVVAALIAGLGPALKATGRQIESGVQSLGARTSAKLGMTWAILVVAQVAISLAFLPLAVELGWGTIRQGVLGPGFAAEQYLTAGLDLDRRSLGMTAAEADEQYALRFGALQTELIRRLESKPEVRGATISGMPGAEPWVRIELDPEVGEEDLRSRDGGRVNHVDAGFFDVFDIPVLAGRGLGQPDFEPVRRVAVVNKILAQRLVGGRSPLGRRIRYSGQRADPKAPTLAEDWYEIVGVVADRPSNLDHGTVYLPAAPHERFAATLSVRFAPNVADAAAVLRDTVVAVDPEMRVAEVELLSEVYRGQQVGNNIGAAVISAVTLSVLLLSAAGLYALMSFTVNQRRREIGIRAALGAQPSRLLGAVFKRAAVQFGCGAVAGVAMASILDYVVPAERIGGWSVPGIIPAAAALMLLIGTLTVVGPARRGLKVQPIEELRDA